MVVHRNMTLKSEWGISTLLLLKGSLNCKNIHSTVFTWMAFFLKTVPLHEEMKSFFLLKKMSFITWQQAYWFPHRLTVFWRQLALDGLAFVSWHSRAQENNLYSVVQPFALLLLCCCFLVAPLTRRNVLRLRLTATKKEKSEGHSKQNELSVWFAITSPFFFCSAGLWWWLASWRGKF